MHQVSNAQMIFSKQLQLHISKLMILGKGLMDK